MSRAGAQGKQLEAFRLRQRTQYDMEMLRELGYCNGIENYSRILSGRAPGETPYTLLDFFPDDFLVFIDESHMTVPQLHGMYEGDRSARPCWSTTASACRRRMDNRPLRFEEFIEKAPQMVFVSATPGELETSVSVASGRATRAADRAGRPEGGGPAHRHQIDDLMNEIAPGWRGASAPWSPPSRRRWPRT